MKPKTVWLCAACGRQADKRDAVGDESCFLTAVEVLADSVLRENGKITATAYVELKELQGTYEVLK